MSDRRYTFEELRRLAHEFVQVQKPANDDQPMYLGMFHGWLKCREDGTPWMGGKPVTTEEAMRVAEMFVPRRPNRG